MGLFDFFRRKPAQPAEDDGPSPDYAFAHYALRQIALSDPLQFLAVAASPDADEFVESILKFTEEQCGASTSFNAADIKIHTSRVHAFPCVVIELPEPKEIAEAHMVGLVVGVDLSSEEPLENTEGVEARYFTLELGFGMTNEPRTVFAEWDMSQRTNYGDGPEPIVDDFVAAISNQLS